MIRRSKSTSPIKLGRLRAPLSKILWVGLAITLTVGLALGLTGCPGTTPPATTTSAATLPERLVLTLSPKPAVKGNEQQQALLALGQVQVSQNNQVTSLVSSLINTLKTLGITVDDNNANNRPPAAINVFGTPGSQTNLENMAVLLKAEGEVWGLLMDLPDAINNLQDFAELGFWPVTSLALAGQIANESFPSAIDLATGEFQSFQGYVTAADQQQILNAMTSSGINVPYGQYFPQYIAQEGQYIQVVIGGLTVNTIATKTIDLSGVLSNAIAGWGTKTRSGNEPGNGIYTQYFAASTLASQVVSAFIVDANNNKVNVTVNCQQVTSTNSTTTQTPVPATATTIAVPNQSTSYSDFDQHINLTATVNLSTGRPVSEGKVTFTIKDSHGVTVGVPVWGTVINDEANAIYNLTGGTGAGLYAVDADYNGSDNVQANSTVASLIVNKASTSTTLAVIPSQTSAAPGYPNLVVVSVGTNVSLKATVTAADGFPVNGGTVTFMVDEGAVPFQWGIPVAVKDGIATTTLSVPPNLAYQGVIETHYISAKYSGGDNLSSSEGQYDKSFSVVP